MATVMSPSKSFLNSRGIKRKRTDGIKFYASNVSVDADSVGSAHEDCISDTPCSGETVSGQSDTATHESFSSPKKRQRVQEATSRLKSSSKSVKKKYSCAFEGCHKAYAKPTRLEEHKRSHTGERPFVCVHPGCGNAYLRESHLQAHARTHRAYAERPHLCPEENCEKRFWTSTQLKLHQNTHDGELKPFKCTELDCLEAFLKHHQLRAHVAAAHSPPGTKSFQCEHEGCSKSFSTSQKLKAHTKTHQADRYVCTTEQCLMSPQYFQTWSLLQAHIKNAHPPTCPHSGCENKKFASQKNFKAHLKVHEERDIQRNIEEEMDWDESQDEKRPPSRNTIEVGRDWKCEWDRCEKLFKSKKAMKVHVNVKHQDQRNFKCDQGGCESAFGYKHLLQRHLAKIHGIRSEGHEDSAGAEGSVDRKKETSKKSEKKEGSFIDILTGKAHKQRGGGREVLPCPWPHFSRHRCDEDAGSGTENHMQVECEAIFHRTYDLRRHLKADHALDVDKVELAAWLAHSS